MVILFEWLSACPLFTLAFFWKAWGLGAVFFMGVAGSLYFFTNIRSVWAYITMVVMCVVWPITIIWWVITEIWENSRG